MAHFDNNIQPNSATLLRDMLRLLASSPELEQVAPAILNESCAISQAAASFVMLFDEPRFISTVGLDAAQLPKDTWLADYASTLSRDVHISMSLPIQFAHEYVAWLVAPLFQQENVVGIFVLLFKETVNLSENTLDLLASLLDALTIVTNSTKSEARQNRLAFNQNEFVRIVSHDLRSPLASVKGFASMLESQMVGELNEKQAHFIEKILSGVEQMTSLVDNIQDAGRYDPERGFYEMQRAQVDLIDMVHNIVDKQIIPAEKQELTLKVSTSDDVPIMNLDAHMLERAIINLVDNAIKYTPNGGLIQVSVKRENSFIVIAVKDDGYGISPDDLKQLFQRHFRIRRQEHKRVKGSGLGLFIVRSVARQHSGDAFVESIEGEGSTFGIRIPLSGDNLLSLGKGSD